MASAFDDAADAQSDPENRYLWRFRPQRLDAEIVRDSMLAVGGNINLDDRRRADLPVHPEGHPGRPVSRQVGEHAGGTGGVAARRLRLPAAVAAVSDVRHVRSSGHERHRRRAQRLDRADAGADAAEQSVRAVAGRASGRRASSRRRAIRESQVDARLSHRAGAAGRRTPRSRSAPDLIAKQSLDVVHARRPQPRRVHVHEVRRCRTAAAGISGTGANSSSDRAAASAGSRSRICSIAQGCWRPRRRRRRCLRGRRGRRESVRAEGAAFQAARDRRHLAVHGRRLEPGGHVRSEAGADEVRRASRSTARSRATSSSGRDFPGR